MIGTLRLNLTLALAITFSVAQTFAQSPPATLPAPTPVSTENNPLPGLPQPPDQPASLFAPPTGPACTPVPSPLPYFEPDERLDPPRLPQPGWFTDIEVAVVDPHVKNKLVDTVTVGAATDTVTLQNGRVDWTAAPRFEVGYRLESGFGEFILGYQFMVSSGSETAAALDAAGTLTSRLNIQTVDLDYASSEWSLWPCWDMKWRFGMRLESIFFDSRLVEPFAAAAAGSGTFAEQDSSWFMGAGPHWGLELARTWHEYGLALFSRVDGWISLGRITQDFIADTTTGTGLTEDVRSQAVVQLTVDAGLRWRPPSNHYLSGFVGYHYEYWWNAGRDSSTLSRGEIDDQGFIVQFGINY
jgi:Legionella pneumophila major outer membrane protein precursor